MKKNKLAKELNEIVIVAVFVQCMFSEMSVHANQLENLKMVTGTKKLIQDGTVVLLVIEALLIAFLMIVQLIQYQMADDNEKPKHKKSAKTTLYVGIIVMSITTIVPVILSYYM